LTAIALALPVSSAAQKSIIASDPRVTAAVRGKIDQALRKADEARDFRQMSQLLVSLLMATGWLNFRELELRLREIGATAHLIALPTHTAPEGATAMFLYSSEDYLQAAARVPPYYLWVAVNGKEEARATMAKAGIMSRAENLGRLRMTGVMTPFKSAYPKFELRPDASRIPPDEGGTKIYGVLREYVRSGHMNQEAGHIVARIVNDYLVKYGTPLRYSVNRQPDYGLVNVYVLASDPGRHFPGIDCNCGYLPGTNAVVCDDKFLRDFRDMITVPLTEVTDDLRGGVRVVNLNFSYFMLQWALGHELGHLFLKHNYDTNYFNVQPMLSSSNRIAPKIRREFEVAADRFAIQNLSDQQEMFYAWLGLSNVISLNYADAIRKQFDRDGVRYGPGDIKPLAAKNRVKLLDTRGAHPPFLLRATQLAQVVLDLHKEIVDTTGHFDRIAANLSISGDGVPGHNMCAPQKN
jgi:hypothetical protein